MKDIVGKVAFVTGGVSGIGRALTEAFAHAGMKVAFTYRRQDHLRDTLNYFRQWPALQVHPILLDVTDRDAVETAAQEVEATFGKVHLLCNNAGINLLGSMDEATYDDWDWILGVNLGGVINTLVTFIPRIKRHGEGGHIVNIASMSSFVTGPGAGLYSTSKFAVRGLSESLRFSLSPHGIGVSLVCPGLTQSNIFEAPKGRPARFARTAFPLSEEFLRRLKDVHSWGMRPEQVAKRTLDAVMRNEFYVFSHSEFKEEVRQDQEEVLNAFPDELPEPRRAAFEIQRRRTKDEARRRFTQP